MSQEGIHDAMRQRVSVVVISYHSDATVLDTLNSIKNQTYGAHNIELIIADDGSRDGTVTTISRWLALHSSLFYSTTFIVNGINAGIPKNCNAAWRIATSDWIKTIAADDILRSECLMLNMIQTTVCPDAAVIFSIMECFVSNALGDKIIMHLSPPKEQQDLLMTASAVEQLNYLNYGDIESTPSAFINREKLQHIGYADERMKVVEDLPLWYKFSLYGYRLHFYPEKTVYYRVAGDSVTHSSRRLINMDFINDLVKIDRDIILPNLVGGKPTLRIRKYLWPKLVCGVVWLFNNKRHVLSRYMLAIVLLVKPNGVKRQWVKLSERVRRRVEM